MQTITSPTKVIDELEKKLEGALEDLRGIKNRQEGEYPSKYLIKAIKQARKNRKEGKGSPTFDNAEDAIAFLEK